MSMYSVYSTDADKETKGVRMEVAPNEDGSVPVFIVAAMSKANVSYSKAMEEATRPYRNVGIQAMGNKLAEKVFLETFVGHCLKGWENVQDESGQTLTFSKENAIKLFEKLPRLYDDLVSRAGSVELFREAQREEEAGN